MNQLWCGWSSLTTPARARPAHHWEEMNMAVITGNTYPVREQLKALGGKWVPTVKGWQVPDAVADEARRLVGEAVPGYKPSGRRSGKCKQCGCGIRYGVYCGKCEYSR